MAIPFNIFPFIVLSTIKSFRNIGTLPFISLFACKYIKIKWEWRRCWLKKSFFIFIFFGLILIEDNSMREKFPCLIYKNSYIVTVTLVSLFPKTVKYYQVCDWWHWSVFIASRICQFSKWCPFYWKVSIVTTIILDGWHVARTWNP